MRNLKQIEANHVSGGLICIDPDTYKKMQYKAINDGVFCASIAAVMFWAIVCGAVNPLAGAISAAVVAPYAAIYTYFNSSTWDQIYE